MERFEVRELPDGVCFDVRVTPRARRDEIVGVHAGALKVTLTAPPADGEANAALIELLAGWLRVAKRDVTIRRGATSRTKSVVIRGVERARVLACARR